LPFRGQGGPALLARARAIEKLGRGGVDAALRLVIEQDPESFAAAEAKRELVWLSA
jgi:hypothetical protein